MTSFSLKLNLSAPANIVLWLACSLYQLCVVWPVSNGSFSEMTYSEKCPRSRYVAFIPGGNGGWMTAYRLELLETEVGRENLEAMAERARSTQLAQQVTSLSQQLAAQRCVATFLGANEKPLREELANLHKVCHILGSFTYALFMAFFSPASLRSPQGASQSHVLDRLNVWHLSNQLVISYASHEWAHSWSDFLMCN